MHYSDDPAADYLRYDAEQQAELDKLPRCSYCDEHITDDYCYKINDELICEECLKQEHRKRTEDYVQ